MADNIPIARATGTDVATVASDEVTDATLGTVQAQYIKIMDGTLGGTEKAVVTSDGLGVNLSTGDKARIGAISETAASSDTADSGLNGLAKRLLQRMTALIALLPASIGTRTAAGSMSVTVASDDPAYAALVSIRDATATVNVAQDTATIKNGSTSLTPKFVAIAASSSGNNTILAAVTSKKIRVLAYNFISNGTVNGKFQSGASGTDLTGLKYCVANSGICAPFNPVGWFETASGTLLNLNLSAGIAVGGELVYIEV